MTVNNTKANRADRWPWIWAAICTLLVLIVAGFMLAYVRAGTAAEKAKAVASCLNDRLGERDDLSKQLAAAENQRIETQRRAEDVKDGAVRSLLRATSATQVAPLLERYAHGEALFKKSLTDYQDAYNRIQRARERRPFGKC